MGWLPDAVTKVVAHAWENQRVEQYDRGPVTGVSGLAVENRHEGFGLRVGPVRTSLDRHDLDGGVRALGELG